MILRTMSSFKQYLIESTKFHPSWQLVRVQAKDIKDPQKKLDFVLDFLNTNPNVHNYQRVLNWVKMTAAGYRASLPTIAASYERNAKSLENNAASYASPADMPSDLSAFSTKDLQKIYQDLKARKYGFQFKSVPVAHTEFLQQLEQELNRRNKVP